MEIPVTEVSNEYRRPLGKIHEKFGGELKTTTAANAGALKFRVRKLTGLPGLSDLFSRAKPHQALILGIPETEQGLILSAARMAEHKGEKPVIQRNKQSFKYPDCWAYLLIDYDPPKGSKPLSAAGVVQLLREVNPELSGVRFLSKPSASAFIYHGDKMLRGAGGCHLYCVVDQGTLIPAAAKLIEARLWVAGHGRVEIGLSGNRLPKTLIDTNVYTPQHLDFIRGYCKPPLSQHMPTPQIHEPTAGGDGVLKLADMLRWAP